MSMNGVPLKQPKRLSMDPALGHGTSPSNRRNTFFHLHLPETHWRGSLTHLHLPTFSVTTPEGESFPRFHFGLRRHSHNTLHRPESMVSLCYQSLSGFINDNNLEGLQQFLENKQVAIDDRDENGSTALMLAAAKGRSNFVRELLSHEADPNAEDSDNWTALLCAAKEGHLDICIQLLENNANIEHRDVGGWTALMWATYKNHLDVVEILLERNADVNAHGNYHVSSLLWASGRGYTPIVETLISYGAKVNMGDKYGTTALIWASRKGHTDIVRYLLQAGANVDTAGMYSWTSLLVATQGNHEEVVNLLLEYRPNVNALDKDGCSALTLACKDGFYEIASSLVNAGTYINIQDRSGDTNLIHAVKGGHRAIVEALLKKYADVNVAGKDKKTALYIAVEKGHVAIAKLLLSANPDLELSTKDGDTPLLKAVRCRNAELVQLLVDKRAKVSASDKKGDTALHIAMRAQSRTIAEILLRNPKHSHLLYRRNKAGESPYNIDISHEKTILGQIFGARRLNTNEDNENMLGYDLFSSALADVLCEPSLSMPITVGLFAKWGSGKSFLLSKLRDEMKNFEREWVDPVFQPTTLLFLLVLHIALLLGTIIRLASGDWVIGVCLGIVFFVICYILLGIVWFSGKRYDWDWPYNFNAKLARKMNNLKLILQILFCHPPGAPNTDVLTAQPIRFHFTDQTRVSSTTGGENSVVQMIGSLYDSIETDYGALPTRLFRAFRPKPIKSSSTWKWRKLCCLPYVIVFEVTFVCFLICLCAFTIYLMHEITPEEEEDTMTVKVILFTTALLIGITFVANLYTWTKVFGSLIFSQRRHLQRAISKLETVKSEGFMQSLRHEVDIMKSMIKCIDNLRDQQTRLVIIVDGLDSCEQEKVLLVLDAIHLLFSDTNNPFVVILAIDPHVIAKVVELNTKRVLNDSNVGGHNYLNNMIHLPFYLQNSGLRKVKIAQQTALNHKKNVYSSASNEESLGRSLSARRLSSENVLMSSTEKLKYNSRKSSRKFKISESVASSIGSNLNKIGGAQDLTKMLLSDDYFSDVNPRSMRRLMNVIYITGRLLKAFQIDFSWYRLALWVNITEQWPFRTSWLIHHYDLYEDTLEEETPLKSLFEKVRPQIPTIKDIEPLLELDRDENKFQIFLSCHKSTLTISDMKVFLPFTINLDPYLKKVIKDETQELDEEVLMFGPSPRTISMQARNLPSPWNQATDDWTTSRQTINRRMRTLQRPASGPTAVVYPQNTRMMSWSQPWGDPIAIPSHSSQYSLGPVTPLLPEDLDVKLSTLSIEGVCNLLDRIDGANYDCLLGYRTLVQENNINGRVLLHCDLEELKRLLQMSFGDWEMFKMSVVSLREQEMTAFLRQDETRNNRFGNARHVVPPQPRERNSGIQKSGNSSNSNNTETDNGKQVDSNRNKQSVVEKQVTLEDQMICGALQTLNEEACEDVMEETECDNDEGTDLPLTYVVPPSPENVQDKHTVRSRANSSSGVIGETDFVILQSSPISNLHWQPISISVQGNTESISEQNSRCNSPLHSPVDKFNFSIMKTSNLKSSTNIPETYTEPSKRQKHVLIRTDSSGKSAVKTAICSNLQTASLASSKTSLPNIPIDHRYVPSQTRPSSLYIKNECKAPREYMKVRSKSIDQQNSKKAKHSSLEKLYKFKDKLLYSTPDLNDDCSEDESTPLVSDHSTPTKSSDAIPLSPLSTVSSPMETAKYDAKRSDLNLTDITEVSSAASYRESSFYNPSKVESSEEDLSPEKTKSRIRTISESTDASVSLVGVDINLKSAGNSQNSLHLSRQDAIESDGSVADDIYCDPNGRE